MHKRDSFCSVSEGMREITVIVEKQYEEKLLALAGEKPLYRNSNLASVEVFFGNAYTETPGMLYMLLQRAALQNINLIEISSTCGGITLFIEESDMRLLVDTMLNSLQTSNKH